MRLVFNKISYAEFKDELLALEWNRVNLFRKTILTQKTKNGKPKTVPLNQIAMDVIVRKSE